MSDGQGGEGRRRLVAFVVLLVVAAPLVLVALLTDGGGEGASGAGLRIERSTVPGTSRPQVTVYVDDPGANVPRTAGGRSTVELQCLDRDDREVVRAVFPWPFTDTDRGVLDPHVHQEVTAQDAQQIVRCRLNGTEGPLEGRPSAVRR